MVQPCESSIHTERVYELVRRALEFTLRIVIMKHRRSTKARRTAIERTASRERRQPRKIRYTVAEWSNVVARALSCGMPAARFVREVSLGAVPRARPSLVHAEAIRVLVRVAERLRQADHSRVDSHHGTDLSELVTEIVGAVEQLDRRGRGEDAS